MGHMGSPALYLVINWDQGRRRWSNCRLAIYVPLMSCNETSRNKSSFLWYLPLFWPVRKSRAVVEPNLSLSQNTPINWYTHLYNDMYISWCVNQVTVFKFFVYSVNKTCRWLLYIISLWDKFSGSSQVGLALRYRSKLIELTSTERWLSIGKCWRTFTSQKNAKSLS